ncbi:hypothetical protein, partial [Microbacterium maritypicum]
LGGALDSARRFLDEGGLEQLRVVLSHDGEEGDKRTRVEKFVGAVRAGSVALATGVTTDLAAFGLMEIATQFFGW